MKSLELQNFLIYSSLVCLCLVICGSCASDAVIEPVDRDIAAGTEEPRIEIYAGTASASFSEDSVSTRSLPEPSRLGYCNADRLNIWFFISGGKNNIPNSEPTKYLDEAVIDRLYSSGPYNSEVYGKCKLDFTLKNETKIKKNYVIAFPAVALEERDSHLYKIVVADNSSHADLTLSMMYDIGSGANDSHPVAALSGQEAPQNEIGIFRTPELFFGFLKGSVIYDGTERVTPFSNVPQLKFTGADNTLSVNYGIDLYGKLYRIVSQYKVNVTEVDPDEVERIDLYFSNVPVSLRLSGNHGAFYQVEANSDCFSLTGEANRDIGGDFGADDYVRVASTDVFPNGVAGLSCYLLPSLTARKMALRIHFKEGRRNDGKAYIDYQIKPKTNAFLRGEDAQVYATGEIKNHPELWKDGEKGIYEDLYVYNNGENVKTDGAISGFYSYANIRVNLSGRYSDIVSDREAEGISIGVGQSFDDVHDIKLKGTE